MGLRVVRLDVFVNQWCGESRLDVGIIKLCNRLINITENIVLLVRLRGGIIKIDF